MSGPPEPYPGENLVKLLVTERAKVDPTKRHGLEADICHTIYKNNYYVLFSDMQLYSGMS